MKVDRWLFLKILSFLTENCYKYCAEMSQSTFLKLFENYDHEVRLYEYLCFYLILFQGTAMFMCLL